MLSKLKFLVRQFPFVYPSRIIFSCRNWIAGQHKAKGDYLAGRGPWFKEIFAESFLHHPNPKTLGPVNDKAFAINKDYPTPKAGLFYLQNSYVMGHKGLVLNKNHQVFQEFSHHFNIAPLKKFFRQHPFYLFTKAATRMQGTGAVLLSPGSDNYYHWLMDVLPRIKLYEAVLDKIDHFCISSNVPAKFLDVLGLFNIPKEKLLLVNEGQKIWFDHLYVASLPGSEGRSPAWAVEYLRQALIAPETRGGNKKIYFKRGQGIERQVLNEEEVEATLTKQGFEIIDPGKLSIAQQIDLMQQANIVISCHGAALSNLLFVKEGTKVIELFSPDYFRTDCFYTLSAMLKLDYWYLAGQKPAGANWGDMVVDVALLKETLNQIG